MVQKTEPVRIDLYQFKLHIRLTPETDLTLHFDSPSRKFYLAVIALVVFEMKKVGKITSIPLAAHLNTLILLNNTVGGSAGSPQNLIPRIYRKWKDVLCDLEHGRLFKVMGRTKCYEDGAGKVYHFREVEKDAWANLFEYTGSQQHLRLRFSIDRINAGLSDVVIVYKEKSDKLAWVRFFENLKDHSKKYKTEPGSSSEMINFQKIMRATGPIDKRTPYLSTKPSIAVLPFLNISKDPDQEYFSDGMSEEIISALAKIEGLKIISRTSAFHFKGKDTDLRTIGEKLKVEHVLEGSVRKAGNRVRISAQLIKVSDDTHLWADTYDRELEDVFAVQDEISHAVVKNLEVKLLGKKTEPLVKDYTKNTEAYELFLKAKYFENKTDYDKAIEYLQQSIKTDPSFVPAYTKLSRINIIGTHLQLRPFWKYKSTISNWIQKAIKIDKNYGEIYPLLGDIKSAEYDWSEAEKNYLRAIELSPGIAHTHSGYSRYLASVGRISDAILEAKRSVELDPLSTFERFHLVWWLALDEQFDQAEKISKEILELDPNNLWGLTGLGIIYISKQMYEDVISILQGFVDIPVFAAWLGVCYGATGKKEAANIILNNCLDQYKSGYFSPYAIALIYCGLGEKDKVFKWLDRAYELQDPLQYQIKFGIFSDLYSDPRWEDVLRKRNLAD